MTTTPGMIVGTLAYMSPEQAEGKPVDARSDIFSFGSVLYEMLSGSRAFDGQSSAALLAAVMRDEPKPLNEFKRDIPAGSTPNRQTLPEQRPGGAIRLRRRARTGAQDLSRPAISRVGRDPKSRANYPRSPASADAGANSAGRHPHCGGRSLGSETFP